MTSGDDKLTSDQLHRSGSQRIVCLNMIVRDESHVIERCLTSVAPLITHWAIVDTGSVDDTVERVRKQLSELPGIVDVVEWQNDFALHRNQALELARAAIGQRPDSTRLSIETDAWLLFIDADETLLACSDKSCAALFAAMDRADVLYWWVRQGNDQILKVAAIKFTSCMRWTGARHELLELEAGSIPLVLTDQLSLEYGEDGYRRRSIGTLEKDASQLQTENSTWRTAYYLAQTHRMLHQYDKAVGQFQRAVRWAETDDERWLAQWRLTEASTVVALPWDAIHSWRALVRQFPKRPETWLGLAIALRRARQYASAISAASCATECDLPEDTAWRTPGARRGLAYDEISYCCFHVGDNAAIKLGYRALVLTLREPALTAEAYKKNRMRLRLYLREISGRQLFNLIIKQWRRVVQPSLSRKRRQRPSQAKQKWHQRF